MFICETVDVDVKLEPSLSQKIEIQVEGRALPSFLVKGIQTKVEKNRALVSLPQEDSVSLRFSDKTLKLTVKVPASMKKPIQVKTISGDIFSETVPLNAIKVITTSGDAKLAKITKVVHESVSGDLELSDGIESMISKNTSGDVLVETESSKPSLVIHTISGDTQIIMRGEQPNTKVTFSSMSGDATIALENSAYRQGDKEFALVFGKGEGQIQVNSVSGDFALKKKN
jgi:DUF4097 and DUF4098 domain-containing protein YvlB